MANSRILIRILVASLSIQQFRWLSNFSKVRWPQNSYKILLGFWSELFWCILKMTNLRRRKLDDSSPYEIIEAFWSDLSLKIRWPQKYCEILQGFQSEFWLPALVSKNSDDYEILQESVDHRILMKFSRNLIRILEFDPYSNQKIRWPLNSSNIPIR